MIDDAKIKRVAEETGLGVDCETKFIWFHNDATAFARAIEQLARQDQREEDARICAALANHPRTNYCGLIAFECAEAIRAAGKENKID